MELPRLLPGVPSPARSPNSLAIARRCAWYAIAWEKFPSDLYAFPRFPYAPPFLARSTSALWIAPARSGGGALQERQR
jgi:hypothetical protein